MNIREQKTEIRRNVSILKKQVTADFRISHSRIILSQVESLAVFKEAETILLYHSLPDEVHTHDFLKKWHGSKRLVLPVVVGDELELRLYHPDNLEPGSYAILEPKNQTLIDAQEVQLALIPGVAFDRCGNRLGRGKGYYDRLLPAIQTPKIGILFDYQLLEAIPHEPFDVSLNGIITESELILGL